MRIAHGIWRMESEVFYDIPGVDRVGFVTDGHEDLLLVRSSLESGLSSPAVTDDSDEKQRDTAAQARVEPELSEPQRVLPELGDAQRAFDVGNYTRVRELTEKLLGDSNDEVRQAAQSLRRRVSVDPFQVGLLLACLAFFVYVTWHYVF